MWRVRSAHALTLSHRASARAYLIYSLWGTFQFALRKELGCKEFVIMEKKFLRTEQLDQNSAVANYFLFFFSLKTAWISLYFLKKRSKMSREASSQGFLIESGETLDSTRTEDVRGKKLRQPDSYWSWIVCAVGAISDVIVLGSAYCFGMIFPHLLEEFKQGKSNTGRYYDSLLTL